ncbi:MAG: hypothetical protein ACR2GU_05405, partial [Rubrobacteraceae bacterium]
TKTVRYAYPEKGEKNTRCMVRRGAIIPIITGLPIGVYGDHIYPNWLWPGSVVDSLYTIAEELVEAFDWPGTDDAAWFVLTGKAPEVRPLDARWETKKGKYFNPQWRIRLVIPPWVPAEEVSRAYRLMRGQIPEGRELPKKTKTLEVARFVWEQERINGYCEPAPWSLWCKRWNKENPENPINDRGNFRTLFRRGAAAVTELNFNWPRPRRAKPGR